MTRELGSDLDSQLSLSFSSLFTGTPQFGSWFWSLSPPSSCAKLGNFLVLRHGIGGRRHRLGGVVG